jgi:hypothetical protein
MRHVLLVALVLLAGYVLGVRLLAALYAPIDLWYTIRTAWPVVVRRVLGWGAATAAALLVFPAGGVRGALLAGIAVSLLVHVATWYLVSRVFRGAAQPSPVVE